MRQNKYKAWDNRNDCWLFDGAVMDLQYSGESAAIMFDNDAHTIPHDSLTWIQFTGLKDRNGKEIYESDIISIGENMNFVVIYDSEFGSFHLDGSGEHMYGANLVEVIGNIYESPELLDANQSIIKQD